MLPCSRRMASKCGPRRPHWLRASGIKRCVAECCSGSWFRRSLVNFAFSVFRSTKSELDDACNKQDFEIEEQITTSIAAFWAWRPPARAYRWPGREVSLRRCMASRPSWLGGIAMPPGSWLQSARRFIAASPLHAPVCDAHPLRIFPCVTAMSISACAKTHDEEGLLEQCCILGKSPVVQYIEGHRSRRAVHVDGG